MVELPLVAAGEIAGTLQKEGGRILSGVDLELIDKNDNIIKTTRTEYDGFFLFEGVPYGKYRIRVSALAANVVGIDARLPQVAELNKANPTVELGIITTRPAARIASKDTSKADD